MARILSKQDCFIGSGKSHFMHFGWFLLLIAAWLVVAVIGVWLVFAVIAVSWATTEEASHDL